MSLRSWFNNNPTITAGIAISVLVIAMGLIIIQFYVINEDDTEQLYFWDVQADAPFPVSRGTVPPIEAPSGGKGVRAHLYTCGQCTPDEWFGYLETNRVEGDRPSGAQDASAALPNRYVRPLEGGRWVMETSDEGQAILDRIYAVYEDDSAAPCGEPGMPPQECLP